MEFSLDKAGMELLNIMPVKKDYGNAGLFQEGEYKIPNGCHCSSLSLLAVGL
jgi:hypothetical protein